MTANSSWKHSLITRCRVCSPAVVVEGQLVSSCEKCGLKTWITSPTTSKPLSISLLLVAKYNDYCICIFYLFSTKNNSTVKEKHKSFHQTFLCFRSQWVLIRRWNALALPCGHWPGWVRVSEWIFFLNGAHFANLPIWLHYFHLSPLTVHCLC